MTEKQETRIKLLKDFTKIDFSNPMGWTGYYDTELKELSQAVETALNMLKEKDKKIEKDRELKHRLCKEVNQMFTEVEEKDKIIDLMARAIDNYDSQLVINTFKDKEHVKEYFERKVEEER